MLRLSGEPGLPLAGVFPSLPASSRQLSAVVTLFRPCIDLHEGQVKQIVGGSLRDEPGSAPRTNFCSDEPAAHFARRYREDGLAGGHVIQLGPGNDAAAREALAAYPGGLQIGGGISVENAAGWLAAGASHVIVTSWLFDADGHLQLPRLDQLVAEVGADRLVIDLSCRATAEGWRVAMNRWQTLTDLPIEAGMIRQLSAYCAEFLVHAADVEGLCGGIDEALVAALAGMSPIPVTYAGGARALEDLERVETLSEGRVDLTIGSGLDIFGGRGVRYADCLAWNRQRGGAGAA